MWTMRKCRNRYRLLLLRSLKLILLFSLVALLILYFTEMKEKEALIDLALGNGKSEELIQFNKDTLVLNGVEGREDKQKLENSFLVIVVTSSPENGGRRNIIRNSWGKKAREYGIVILFFLGMPTSDDTLNQLGKENAKFKDLLMDDFRESYYALTIKTLRIMKYFKFHHPKSKFLVKTDDDVFVNVPNLLLYCFQINKMFEDKHKDSSSGEINQPQFFVGGVIHIGREPHTWNPFSKWYAPSKVWSRTAKKAADLAKIYQNEKSTKVTETLDGLIYQSQYPPYAEGNFYILSDDAITGILNVSQHVPLYHLEDVFVTGVIANWILKIELEQVPMISSASNMFPRWSYFWYKMFTSPKATLAFHCDNHVDLITTIYEESIE